MKVQVQATLKNFNKGQANFVTADQKIISWPKSDLPKKLAPGEKVIIELKNSETIKKEKEQIAKKLLQEIIDSADEEKNNAEEIKA